MKLDTNLIHGNRKADYDKEVTELFAAGYNANQAFRILKKNGVVLSRGTIYSRWIEYKEKSLTSEQN